MKVLIAGAGIGGLTAAIALRRVGIDVEIFEKAALLRERGAAILLWPNATRVLRDLGVLDALMRKGDAVTHCEIRSWNGRSIKRWNVPTLATPAIFIHRADLQSTLLAALPHELLRLGHALAGFEQDATRVRACFAADRAADGDVLIGADGLHSRTREHLFGRRNSVYQGYTQWLAIVNTVHDVLEPGLKMEWWGRGTRFGIASNGMGRMNWYLSANRPAPRASPVGKADLLEWVRDWQAPVKAIIQSTPEESIIHTDIWACPSSKAWGRERVTLLGDAAHPTSPNLGQGAGMAIEDAGCLAACLQAERVPATALRRYESLRTKRTAATTARSGLVGRMGQWHHPALVAARTTLLRAIPVSLWERQLQSLFSHTVDVS